MVVTESNVLEQQYPALDSSLTGIPKIIGLCGPMGSGKSFAGQILCDLLKAKGRSIAVIPIAYELKQVARSLGWNGLKDEKGRRGLQLLGTDVVRECFDEDHWIKAWRHTVLNTPVDHVICDDVRFPNEEKVLRELGGVLIQIRLNGLVTASTHASERVDLLTPDETVWSDFGLPALTAALKQSATVRSLL